MARKYLKTCQAFYDAQPPQAPDMQAGHDPNVACRIWRTWALWALGYTEQARQRSQEGVTLASNLSHPYSLAYTLLITTILYTLLREAPARLQVRAAAAMALCTAQGFETYLAGSTILHGWALAAQGQCTEGIAQICQGLVAWKATGAELCRPLFLALLAGAYRSTGQIEESLTTLTEALACVDATGEHFYEAELHRLKGELLLQHAVPGASQAEVCFHQALAIARRQQAKSWELRTAISLSRLWQRQGKRAEAHQLLADIYGWFTEGFDTADPQEAKALLEELG
jgi:predicted ATPase